LDNFQQIQITLGLQIVMKQIIFLVLLSAALLAAATEPERPRIGLVLSGGGARGAAHIGVLKVLEELRIPIDVVVGTSMGALTGGAYASGVSVEEMERRVTSTDWNELFNDDPPRRLWPARRKQASMRSTWEVTVGVRDGETQLATGAISGQQVELFFADLVQGVEQTEQFDDLPIPFRAVATDLENGQMKVFGGGSLAQAMRASMSVPGLFAPMEIDKRLYVDGGLVRNLPVDVARSLDVGVDVIIAINLGSTYLKRDQLGSIFGVAGQMLTILTEQNVARSLAEIDSSRDVLISPQLGSITSADFDRAAEAIAIGEQAARGSATALSRYSLSEPAYRQWREQHFNRPTSAPAVIDQVQVAGLERVNEGLFGPLQRDLQGKPLDRPKLERDLNRLYGRGDFERLNYHLQQDGGRNLLIVDAVEKPWGPGYLNFGLGIMSDFLGDIRTGIRATYRQTWVNRLGAEWLSELTVGNESRLFSEFYQPLRLDRAGFVVPYLDISESPLSLYLLDKRIARFDILRSRVGLDVGTTLGASAELRFGAYLGQVHFDLDTGDPLLFPTGDEMDSGLRASFISDTLDSPYVPTSGHWLSLSARMPLSGFGAESEYARLYADWRGAFSSGDNSFLGTLRYGSSLGDEMPYYDQFPLGGFLKLSGYANEQFRGNDLGYGNVVYYRRISSLPSILGRGLYVGGSLEVGKVWNTPGDGILNAEETRYGSSLFFAADSLLGPFVVAVGLTGDGDSTFYVVLGQP